MIDLSVLMLTVFYAMFGILMMIVSNIVIDFFIPGDFSEEIRRGNRAVAWLSAGSFIGIGEILRAVIVTPVYDAVPLDFVGGVTASAGHACGGVAGGGLPAPARVWWPSRCPTRRWHGKK